MRGAEGATAGRSARTKLSRSRGSKRNAWYPIWGAIASRPKPAIA